MEIISREVEVKPSGKMIKHYRDKGYDAKYHQPLIVKVEDLPKNSHVRIDVLCDVCKEKISNVIYQSYNKTIDNNGFYVCKECSLQKQYENNIKKYGVPYSFQVESVKEKIRQTNLERYGVENYAMTKECHEKMKSTCMERYNVEYAMQFQEIKNKAVNTTLKRFGVKNVFALPEVKEKIKQTNLKKYGYFNPMQSSEVRAKVNKTLCENGTQKTSKQQIYLHNLYGGEINFCIDFYSVDICFPDEKFLIEYDGGGHDLRVTLGRLTQEEFDQKEIVRSNILKREGYKQMRIISQKDKLPSDQILLQMLDYARNYFSQYPNHSWIEFNIDTSSIRSAEHKDGIQYNYGELRTISKVNIDDVDNVV